MSRTRKGGWKRHGVGAGALLVPLALALVASCGAPPPPRSVPVTSATITVRYSRFEPSPITVPAGSPVTFHLRNDDPIEHEWIVGPAHVHDAHRTGSEPVHDSRPDEITLPPYATRTTTLTFQRPGDYPFICHLPGHEAYGMTGLLRVAPT